MAEEQIVRVRYAKPHEHDQHRDRGNPYDELEFSVTGRISTVANFIAGDAALSGDQYVQGEATPRIQEWLKRGGLSDCLYDCDLFCEHVPA